MEQRRKLSGTALSVALAAMILRVLLPVGVMPTAQGMLVLCTGHGPLVLGAPTGTKQTPPTPQHDTPCSFSGLASAAPLPQVAEALPAAYVFFCDTTRLPAQDVVPGRGLAAPPPPAQGPPPRI